MFSDEEKKEKEKEKEMEKGYLKPDSFLQIFKECC